MKNRLRSLQKNGGDIQYLEVILGSKNFGDFINRTVAVNKIMEQDNQILETHIQEKIDLENNKQQVEENKTKVEENKVQVEKDKETVTAQRDQVASEKKQLESQKASLAAEEIQTGQPVCEVGRPTWHERYTNGEVRKARRRST